MSGRIRLHEEDEMVESVVVEKILFKRSSLCIEYVPSSPPSSTVQNMPHRETPYLVEYLRLRIQSFTDGQSVLRLRRHWRM